MLRTNLGRKSHERIDEHEIQIESNDQAWLFTINVLSSILCQVESCGYFRVDFGIKGETRKNGKYNKITALVKTENELNMKMLILPQSYYKYENLTTKAAAVNGLFNYCSLMTFC